jgi:hypothetical protein
MATVGLSARSDRTHLWRSALRFALLVWRSGRRFWRVPNRHFGGWARRSSSQRSMEPQPPRRPTTIRQLRDAASPHRPATAGRESGRIRALDVLARSSSTPECIPLRFVVLRFSKRIMRETHGTRDSTHGRGMSTRSSTGAEENNRTCAVVGSVSRIALLLTINTPPSAQRDRSVTYRTALARRLRQPLQGL